MEKSLKLDGYRIRRGSSPEDGETLYDFFTKVFHPQPVGTLAKTFYHHLPHMERRHWFMAEDKETEELASAFALIPWVWEMEGIRLKVAEMGIVGTGEKHRKKGLMKVLNREFDAELRNEGYDMAVIQGIPGFYHHFGYSYAVAMENHIDLPLHVIPDVSPEPGYLFRLAGNEDIPFLMEEDRKYRDSFCLSVFRDEAAWRYLLTESAKTEYGAEFWIIENSEKGEKFYCRIPFMGFGKGLILSEVSEPVAHGAVIALFSFLKKKALALGKPHIRLNLHNLSTPALFARHMGAEDSRPYAWQIKIPDPLKILEKIAPILKKRMRESCFYHYSGVFRLEFYQSRIDLHWQNGKLASLNPGGNEECANTLCVPADLFPALCLGHRTWRELQNCRPEIFPASQYIRPDVFRTPDITGLMTDVLFPSCRSWIYERY